ncbi:DNA mismatch repair endonuclease MutL [Enterococcus sp. BWM-S5]|uniref:DNA mismatch repair protein MutL n=1 Tax=Enterococcus larvae TaxID=2794352 RepID=A0ABS4CN43_9ENTE|nr:DNA mismatch repair endonuclease MutL [Enterococcus larvae]MBP1048003.1 DNA mismatch repair endonuclease MutL [Enterococcus larvae]
MGKIKELSEQLANQIAAGEVVERPASVVKELVENAIDAGSTQIDIFIEEAGLKTIQVIDNGDGIAKDDVLNAFKRHATSKIHTRDDLFRIRSLGFRGEALPSITSVSEVTLETAVADEEEGSYVKLIGGKVEEHRPGALRKGTKITVENLFFNTPARLKYVKTIQTELATVGDIVNRLALSHPMIAFRLVHDGNKMMSTTGSGDLKQTVAGIYGISTAKKMLEIKAKDLDFEVSGFVSLPEVTRASRNYLSTIINGRYIKNFMLNKAIINGYGSKLMVGRFPIAVLEVTMDPLLVDVNVHPTKQEVRLSKEKELMALITQAIQEALSQEQLIPNAAANLQFKKKVERQEAVEQMEIPLAEEKTETSTYTSDGVRKPGSLNYDSESGRFFVAGEKNAETAERPTTDDTTVDREAMIVEESAAVDYSAEKVLETEKTAGHPLDTQNIEISETTESLPQEHLPEGTIEQVQQQEVKEPSPDSFIVTAEEEERNHPVFDMTSKDTVKELNRTVDRLEHEKKPERFPVLEYFGQMHGTYLFAQSKEGLYIIDQHAAQERIKYEYFREKIGEVSNDLQELLVPIVLDYPNSDVIKINEQKEKLEGVGIYLEDFGQNSFIVRAHPTWYPGGEEEEIIRGMIDMLLLTGQVDVKKFREATAIMMSCKRSIKANHYLNEQQARILLNDLAECANPFNCPHGRPVLIHFTNSDMEKMFKRIQDPH